MEWNPSFVSYPVPISPPFTEESKLLELQRAHHASFKSSLYSPSPSDVLFHDQWLLLLNKPSGIYSDSLLSSLPGLISTFDSPTDADRVPFDPDLRSHRNHELHLANRLDRDTSGVIIITKCHAVAAELVKAFTEHKVEKTYIARCVGSAPKWEEITLRSGHGRSKHGAWRVYGESDIGRRLPGGSSVKEMETCLMVVAVNGVGTTTGVGSTDVIHAEEKAVEMDSESMDEILVRARPNSGRSHQIRLHCRYVGIPIVGDVKYGGICEWKGMGFSGHQLHAERLVFKHPVTGVVLDVLAPLPPWAYNFRDHYLKEGSR